MQSVQVYREINNLYTADRGIDTTQLEPKRKL